MAIKMKNNNLSVLLVFIFNNDNLVYYLNTNEIPSELSHENMISSHVKISLLLWLHIKITPFGAFCEMI